MNEILQALSELDADMLLFINGMHNDYFDNFMYAFSGKLVWVPLYVSLVYLIFRNLRWRMALGCAVAIALTIVFADQIGASLIRPEVCRLRPSNLDNPLSEWVHIVNGYRGGRYGFPSCHAANTFGLAFFLYFLSYDYISFIVGSNASRNPSPTRLKLNIKMENTTTGMIIWNG